MQRLRVPLAVAILLVVSGPAGAARPKALPKTCNLLTDAAADAHYPVEQAPSQNFVDIVSGDVATKGTTLAAAIRVKGKAETDPAQGFTLRIHFTTPDKQNLYLGVRFDPVNSAVNGLTFDWGVYAPATGVYTPRSNISGRYDTASNEYRIWATFTQLQVKVAPRAPITAFGADSEAWSVPFYGSTAPLPTDTAAASSKSVYYVGGPSCLRVGS
jgi:hypothetical protein